MKINPNITVSLLIGIATVVTAQKHHEEEFTETIKKSLSFERSSDANAFFVDNVSGTIDVVGYSGKTIEVEVLKTIKAHDKEVIEIGRREIKVGEYQGDNTIYLYLDAPFNFLVKQGDKWVGYFNLPRGNHHYSFIVDGEEVFDKRTPTSLIEAYNYDTPRTTHNITID